MRSVSAACCVSVVVLVAACATQAPPPPAPVILPPPVVEAPPPAPVRHTELMMLAGLYRCELNRQVNVKQVSDDQESAILAWNKRDYTLRAVKTSTGALRYEDRESGLTWIGVSGKSMLLDTKHGKQLANECRA